MSVVISRLDNGWAETASWELRAHNAIVSQALQAGLPKMDLHCGAFCLQGTSLIRLLMKQSYVYQTMNIAWCGLSDNNHDRWIICIYSMWYSNQSKAIRVKFLYKNKYLNFYV